MARLCLTVHDRLALSFFSSATYPFTGKMTLICERNFMWLRWLKSQSASIARMSKRLKSRLMSAPSDVHPRWKRCRSA